MDAWTIVGTVASVIGLIVSGFTFHVAKGAEEAANRATAAAIARNLIEELEMGERRIHDIGTFLDLDQWAFVRLRAMELVSICGTVTARWPDELSIEKKNNILMAQELVLSIGSVAAMSKVKAPTREAVKAMATTQLRASQLISGALAEARSQQERGAA